MATIGQNLKRLRAVVKLSQVKLAERSGVSQQLISQLENGKNETTKELPALAKALGVSISEIDENYAVDHSTGIMVDVPRVSWITAGEMADQDAVVDLSEFPTVPAADLPAGQYIALKVEPNANSMNKISPPESVIFVNLADRRLVPNACYVITDERGRVTYKRYRPNDDPPFQPASYDDVEPPELEGAITVVGRVKRSMIDM